MLTSFGRRSIRLYEADRRVYQKPLTCPLIPVTLFFSLLQLQFRSQLKLQFQDPERTAQSPQPEFQK